MSISQNLDERIKEKNSLLFRIIIIIYSLTIVIRYNNPPYGILIYIVVTTIYFLLFRFLSRKNPICRILRLANDFTFIIFILYKLGTPNAHLAVFVLLPLINTLNHTHNKIRKSFSIQLFIFTAITFFVVNHYKIDFYFLIPISAITTILLFLAIRVFLDKFNNTLDNVIESYHSTKGGIFKSYKVIRAIIATFNNDAFLMKFLKITRITFFKIGPSNIPNITISSDFIYKYQLDILPKQDVSYYIPELNGELNGRPIENGVGIHIKSNVKNTSYITLVEFENRINRLFLVHLVEKIFIPIFNRIIAINNFENEVLNLKKDYFEKAKQEFENIDSAANAVHFLANKLTPVTNYFKMLEAFNEGKIPVDKQQEWQGLINEDLVRATKNIRHIQAKMMQIAQYTNNPNIVSEFEPLKIKSFVTFLRKTFLEACFCSSNISIDISEKFINKSISVNVNALDFVFVEFIDNFNKHSEDDINLNLFTEKDGSILTVQLVNKIKDYENKIELLSEYVNDFNTGEVSELLQRRGNKGIKFLKQFLIQLKISHFSEVKDGYMYINLKFILL